MLVLAPPPCQSNSFTSYPLPPPYPPPMCKTVLCFLSAPRPSPPIHPKQAWRLMQLFFWIRIRPIPHCEYVRKDSLCNTAHILARMDKLPCNSNSKKGKLNLLCITCGWNFVSLKCTASYMSAWWGVRGWWRALFRLLPVCIHTVYIYIHIDGRL